MKNNQIFEVVPDEELRSLYKELTKKAVIFVGRSEDGSQIVFLPTFTSEDSSILSGSFRISSKVIDSGSITATFSFVWNETKYLLKAILHIKERHQGALHLITQIYRIQRRAVKRLKIPNDYYAVVRLSHQNSRLIRSYGKIVDISPQGLGIFLPKTELKFKQGDLLKAVLTISQRPPESIELRVVHLKAPPNKSPAKSSSRASDKSEKTEKNEGQFLGAAYLPENSRAIYKKMNAVVMDIYRDIFGALTEKKLPLKKK